MFHLGYFHTLFSGHLGYAAGSYYVHVGAGSDFICLNNNVTYTAGHYISGRQGLMTFCSLITDV